jgi:hypothetical protein
MPQKLSKGVLALLQALVVVEMQWIGKRLFLGWQLFLESPVGVLTCFCCVVLRSFLRLFTSGGCKIHRHKIGQFHHCLATPTGILLLQKLIDSESLKIQYQKKS